MRTDSYKWEHGMDNRTMNSMEDGMDKNDVVKIF